MTFIFALSGNVIIPIDFHMFQRGRLNHQLAIEFKTMQSPKLQVSEPSAKPKQPKRSGLDGSLWADLEAMPGFSGARGPQAKWRAPEMGYPRVIKHGTGKWTI